MTKSYEARVPSFCGRQEGETAKAYPYLPSIETWDRFDRWKRQPENFTPQKRPRNITGSIAVKTTIVIESRSGDRLNQSMRRLHIFKIWDVDDKKSLFSKETLLSLKVGDHPYGCACSIEFSLGTLRKIRRTGGGR